MFDFLFSMFSNDMGIDLGTANTLVCLRGKGIVLREPSVVASDRETRQILAVGAEAKKMLGRTPAVIQTVRPLKNGVIADFAATQEMIKYFIRKVHQRSSLLHPRIVISVPSGISGVERRAVNESAEQLVLYQTLSSQLAPDQAIHLHFGVVTKAQSPAVQLLDVPTRDQADADKVISLMLPVWNAMKAGVDFASPSPMSCATCGYQSRCPAYCG